jgi:Plant transposon protein
MPVIISMGAPYEQLGIVQFSSAIVRVPWTRSCPGNEIANWCCVDLVLCNEHTMGRTSRMLIRKGQSDMEYLLIAAAAAAAGGILTEPVSEARVHGGSRHGKAKNRERGIRFGEITLRSDYFSFPSERNLCGTLGPVKSEAEFCQRFRIPRNLYAKIRSAVCNVDPFFVQTADCTGQRGASTDQKLYVAFSMLCDGSSAASTCDYARVSKSLAQKSFLRFCGAVVKAFYSEYMRDANADDISRIERQHAEIGFPGCVGSIDCASWAWDNCPIAEHGIYKGKERKPCVRMEIVCDDTLRIWSLFFGSPGSNNDINISNNSPLVNKMKIGAWPPTRPSIHVGNLHLTWHYLLADSIYPRSKIFLRTVREPKNAKEKLFSTAQEGARKAVERVFAVLFARFRVLKYPARLWYKSDMANVIKTACIMHNMIIDDRREKGRNCGGTRNIMTLDLDVNPSALESFQIPRETSTEEDRSTWAAAVRDVSEFGAHLEMQEAFIEYLWEKHGSKDLRAVLQADIDDLAHEAGEI